MRIQNLSVSNFRAITHLSLASLSQTVVIAGPNGCGKSCVFDAIRLLKSVYGGYQPNEWQSWFGEFQINVNQQQGVWISLFQNKSLPLKVDAGIVLSETEQSYLREHAKELLTEHIWKDVVPELASWRFIEATPLAANLRVHQGEVDERVLAALPGFLSEIAKTIHEANVTILPNGSIETTPSLLLEVVFSRYDPQHIGIIDYHGATRNYGREQIGGINLNIESSEARLRQHALYNSANKYANLKSEMAGSYIRHLLACQADKDTTPDQSLSDTLKELFTTFFPGKEFLGPRPTVDGRLLFPVRTANGAEHDIDDLSSGEKEVLYGYLRLRNAAPRDSVLLIDEPELHLNPRLMNGLATFYHRHLGGALGNQLWLVTHSDTLIREAVGQKNFSVYHLQPPDQFDGANQASLVQVGRELERLVVELVGDLAAYRPGAKIVVFEGGGDSEFDVRMVSTLFPRFQAAVNPISGGNKHRVAQLYELLEDARRAGHLPAKFYAITDSDGDMTANAGITTHFKWDVYHIENYLLEPTFILRVLGDLNLAVSPVDSVAGVLNALHVCATQTIPTLVAHAMKVHANQALLKCLNLNFDMSRTDAAAGVASAALKSRERMDKVFAEDLTIALLEAQQHSLTEEASKHLKSSEWLSKFHGRDILRRFVNSYATGIRYEPFRDLIIARMRDAEFEPSGMKKILDQILTDSWRS